jgi:hypothetical protein
LEVARLDDDVLDRMRRSLRRRWQLGSLADEERAFLGFRVDLVFGEFRLLRLVPERREFVQVHVAFCTPEGLRLLRAYLASLPRAESWRVACAIADDVVAQARDCR